MSGNDPSDESVASQNQEASAEEPIQERAGGPDGDPGQPRGAEADSQRQPPKRRILIGSQRDPAAYRPKPARDWIPIAEPESEQPQEEQHRQPAAAEAKPPTAERPPAQPETAPRPDEAPGQQRPQEQQAPTEAAIELAEPADASPSQPTLAEPTLAEPPEPSPPELISPEPADASPSQPTLAEPPEPSPPELISPEPAESLPPEPAESLPPEPTQAEPVPVPSVRDALPPDLEQEFHDAMADTSLEELLSNGDGLTKQKLLEPETQHTGQVIAVQRDDVFIELGGRDQGCVPLKQFAEPPEPGAEIQVIVRRFNTDDGLYDLTIPEAAAEVEDWGDLKEGMLVEARVTGHNDGGLECEVNQIRGFIPISQVSLHRVENPAEFADQKFTCLVTEANPERRNLVLSRRAVLEREKEEARQKFLDSLEPGQVHEGVVRRLVDFGAFVDIGGVDGLLHVSQLSWGRVDHPRDVLAEGQKIQVKIEKFDRATGKIGLAYRDLLENPWDKAPTKYPPNTVVQGTVSRLAEFGAFVELEPGVEGLVHISELSHRRVWRASDVVSEGERIEVLVLSVDAEAQRISLSLRALSAEPEPAKEEKPSEPGKPPARTRKRKKPGKPLQGGLGKSSGGQGFGLKW